MIAIVFNPVSVWSSCSEEYPPLERKYARGAVVSDCLMYKIVPQSSRVGVQVQIAN
jgi:hypothetical protein